MLRMHTLNCLAPRSLASHLDDDGDWRASMGTPAGSAKQGQWMKRRGPRPFVRTGGVETSSVGLLPAPKQFHKDKKHTIRTSMIRFSCTLCRVSFFHKIFTKYL